MHFTTLYLLKGETLDNISKGFIEEDFCDRFCYCNGETRPKYQYWCDWFLVGGRWNDTEVLKAKRGIRGENGIGEYGEPTISIAEIKDLEGDIEDRWLYAIATKSRIYTSETEEFKTLLNKINKKLIKGVVALIDCHD